MSALSANTPKFALANGYKVPAIGFGSGTKWQWAKKGRHESEKENLHEELVLAVKQALDKGFRHIDTSEVYTTEPEIAEAIIRSGLPRKELFVTHKYNPGHPLMGKATDSPYEALVKGLKKLKMDYVDLYLIHTPIFFPDMNDLTLKEVWKSLEKLQREGLAKNIGVSNFDIKFLNEILEIAEIKPCVNQIEYHPYLPNQTPKIVDFCKKNGMLVEAYSPLAPLFRGHPGPLDELLPKLAAKYKRSETQILLRWVYQNGVLPLTTTSNGDRCVDALNVFSFELSKEDVELISQVGKTKYFKAFFKEEYKQYDEELAKDYTLTQN